MPATRRQFGKPIAENQGLQWMLADMAKDITAGAPAGPRAAMTLDDGPARDHGLLDGQMLRRRHGRARRPPTPCRSSAARGYIRGFEVERLYRDAKITQIYEGTNQIQRTIIARELIKAAQ